MFNCIYLKQEVVDDLFDLESQGAKGFIAKQVGRFLSGIPEHIEGIEAAIETNDFEKIRHHAHKLNGFSGTLGAYKIREITLLIERDSIDKNPDSMSEHFGNLTAVIEKVSPELEEIARISERNVTYVK
ncbi:Hpt domain-containing protein [bacterium]|nr:Hpt domain-containing protein [bacterium]